MIMKIALPTHRNMVDDHFGHCEFFTVFTLSDDHKILDYQKAIQDVIEGRQDAICIKITEGCVEPRSGTEGLDNSHAELYSSRWNKRSLRSSYRWDYLQERGFDSDGISQVGWLSRWQHHYKAQRGNRRY